MNAKCKKRNGLGTIILKKTLKKSANNNKREREGPTTTTSIELEIKEEKRVGMVISSVEKATNIFFGLPYIPSL